MKVEMIPFPYLTNPKLHDRVVQKVRTYLDNNLSFPAWSFHIARPAVDENDEVYPQIYAQDGSKTHFDLRPDWGEKAFFFFELNDSTDIADENEGTTYNVSLIFYGRLDEITADTKDYTADIIAEFILHLRSASLQARGITYQLDPDDIWGKYTALSESRDQNFMRYGTTFKLNFTMLDFEDCYEELL